MTHTPIGARRRRFVLETPLDTPDGFGGSLRRWVAGPVIWGSIARAQSDTRERNGREDTVVVYRVGLRWRPGVTSDMRLAAGPRRFAIRSSADPDGRRRDLVCDVEELAPGEPA
jgi:head-tail adaptor